MLKARFCGARRIVLASFEGEQGYSHYYISFVSFDGKGVGEFRASNCPITSFPLWFLTTGWSMRFLGGSTGICTPLPSA